MRTGIILSGGKSSRLGQDKGLVKLEGRPLVSWIIDILSGVVDEIIVVVGSEETIPRYWEVVPNDVRIVTDCYPEDSPLIGLITGLKEAKGEYAVVCACDMPFVDPVILEMLFCISYGLNGTLLQKPNGWIEPFPSVFHVANCLETAERLRDRGELRIRRVLETMNDKVSLPIEKLREIDLELVSFIDLDTMESVEAAKHLLKPQY
ncbi:MAG: molybdenum cofactor guanylyltransferase [Candidatus Bathyarchaeota archaeon]|nr:molybdenum cofactor guanylyltransferase [Candidatus Bathyarchaeota archaeon]